MTFTWTKVLAAAIGVIAAFFVLEAPSKPLPPRADLVMLPECGGTLREIVIQYVSGDAIALPIYRQFVPQLSAGTRVNVLCPDQQSFHELAGKLGSIPCALSPIITGHEMTVWSRDRWIAVRSPNPDGPIGLLAPTDEDGSATWPQRAGDARIAMDIAKAFPGSVTARRLPLYFDGGDLLATDAGIVFVAPRVLDHNINRTVASREELIDLLHRALGAKVVLLTKAPDHHLGMYMMAAGDHTVLVADPSRARPLVTPQTPELPGGADFSSATQELFDAVAREVAEQGFTVIRIPTLPASDGKTFLTYLNVMTENRDGKKRVYLPSYQGAEALNAAAAQIWRSVGYEVHPIDCTSSYRYFGNLHCLVNVLRRR